VVQEARATTTMTFTAKYHTLERASAYRLAGKMRDTPLLCSSYVGLHAVGLARWQTLMRFWLDGVFEDLLCWIGRCRLLCHAANWD
jgi:hypothetical protein